MDESYRVIRAFLFCLSDHPADRMYEVIMAGSTQNCVISVQEVYGLGEFQRRTGLGEWAMRKARQAGLKTTRIGVRRYVRGSDWHQFLERRLQKEPGQ